MRVRVLLACVLAMLFIACSGADAPPAEDARVSAGRALYDRSDYDAAQKHFQSLLADAEREGNTLVAAQARKWLGSIVLAYDKPDEALPWYRGSLDIIEREIARTDSARTAAPQLLLEERQHVLSNIAVVYKATARFDEAEKLFGDVLAQDRARGDGFRTAVSLYNLADVHHQKSLRRLQARDSAAFLREHGRALDLLRQSLATHPTADAHLNLGNVHAVADRLDSAIASYHRAEALYDAQGYRVHRALALGNIGVLSLRLNRLDAAADALRRSIGILEELRGNISSIDIRSSFISNKFYIYENLIGILIQQGRVDEAFEYVERAKARSFLDMIGNKAVGEGKKRDEATAALIQRERALQRRIEAVLGNADSARVLGEAIEDHQRVIAALRERDPEYASVKSIEPLPLAELRRMLDGRTAVVEYFVGERSAFGFAVTRDTIVVRRMQVDRGNALEREIEALRRMLYVDFPNTKFSVLREKRMKDRLSPREALASWRATPVPSTWQYSLVTMYSRFLAPFAGVIEDKEVLYIVPHGPLHHLPFQALIRPADIDTRADVHIARPRYLIERHAIALLPSVSVLPFALRRDLVPVRSGLIVGDPLYADPKYRSKPLEAALIEADTVSRYVPQPTVLTREAAEEVVVKNELIGKDVVHLATHGELNKEQPLRSRILFAAARPDSVNNGDLTVAKIFNLDLQAVLVTLSACQTAQVAAGKGQSTAGDDLVGLTRSFMYAGTPAVIASLWFVDDASTLDWMRYFYRAWLNGGRSRVQAARQAALDMLSAPADPDWVHPYYWAAFVYMGDAR